MFKILFIQFICDNLTEFNKDNEEEYRNDIKRENNILNYTFKIEYHYLIQDLLRFIGIIICGIILYIFYKHFEQKKDGEISLTQYQKMKNLYFGEKESINFSLFSIGFFYSFNIILGTFYISLNCNAAFWTLEILFIIYLSYKFLKVHIGNYQKVTIFVLAGILLYYSYFSIYLKNGRYN